MPKFRQTSISQGDHYHKKRLFQPFLHFALLLLSLLAQDSTIHLQAEILLVFGIYLGCRLPLQGQIRETAEDNQSLSPVSILVGCAIYNAVKLCTKNLFQHCFGANTFR